MRRLFATSVLGLALLVPVEASGQSLFARGGLGVPIGPQDGRARSLGSIGMGLFGATLTTAALVTRAALLRDKQGVLAPDKLDVLLDGEVVGGGECWLVGASRLLTWLQCCWVVTIFIRE